MFDSVDPSKIPADLIGRPALQITVLADPAGEAFDVEQGNVSASKAVGVIAGRLAEGKWSVVYVDEAAFAYVEAALGPQNLRFADASEFPAAGVYLWVADPSGNVAAGRWRLPVAPVAVQGGQIGGCDVSQTAPTFGFQVAGYIDGPLSAWPASAWTLFADLAGTPIVTPSGAPTPTPAPPAPATHTEVDVRLPILQSGSEGPTVRVVQHLLGGIAVDGVFGAATEHAVTAFQSSERLAVDGIVGLHTWGALLGCPQ